jgi:hypothetical protein
MGEFNACKVRATTGVSARFKACGPEVLLRNFAGYPVLNLGFQAESSSLPSRHGLFGHCLFGCRHGTHPSPSDTAFVARLLPDPNLGRSEALSRSGLVRPLFAIRID